MFWRYARWGGYHVVCMVRHPRGSYIVSPLLSLEIATPENKEMYSKVSSVCKKVCTRCGFPPLKWLLV